MNSRIERIREMLAKDPKDTFLMYSLGMELASAGEFDQAVEQFRSCLALDANYLPAYAEGGRALRSAGLPQEARKMFAAGVELAARLGESHTRDYLRQQLDCLPPEA